MQIHNTAIKLSFPKIPSRPHLESQIRDSDSLKLANLLRGNILNDPLGFCPWRHRESRIRDPDSPRSQLTNKPLSLSKSRLIPLRAASPQSNHLSPTHQLPICYSPHFSTQHPTSLPPRQEVTREGKNDVIPCEKRIKRHATRKWI
jgi:hypothetical protein